MRNAETTPEMTRQQAESSSAFGAKEKPDSPEFTQNTFFDKLDQMAKEFNEEFEKENKSNPSPKTPLAPSANTQLFDFGLNSQLSEKNDEQNTTASQNSAVQNAQAVQILPANSSHAPVLASLSAEPNFVDHSPSHPDLPVNTALTMSKSTRSKPKNQDPRPIPPPTSVPSCSSNAEPISKEKGTKEEISLQDIEDPDEPVPTKTKKNRRQLLKAKQPRTADTGEIEEIVIDDSTPTTSHQRQPARSRLSRKKRDNSKNGDSKEPEDHPSSSASSKIDSAIDNDSGDDFVVSSYNARKRLRLRKK